VAAQTGSSNLKQYLRGISEAQLAAWMQEETLTASGVNTLYKRFIKRLGPGATQGYIFSILKFPLAEAARATVRADLYSNWHCAQYGSNRLDLADDMLHVLQAMYCDVYLTEEKNQLKYAPLLLTPRTRVAIYLDRTKRIDEWILSLV